MIFVLFYRLVLFTFVNLFSTFGKLHAWTLALYVCLATIEAFSPHSKLVNINIVDKIVCINFPPLSPFWPKSREEPMGSHWLVNSSNMQHPQTLRCFPREVKISNTIDNVCSSRPRKVKSSRKLSAHERNMLSWPPREAVSLACFKRRASHVPNALIKNNI